MIAVVAVKIVWPCPSGRSFRDCRARAKAMAPLSPVCACQIYLIKVVATKKILMICVFILATET